MANERESKRWNDDRWVAAWAKREKLTDALSPYLLKKADARPGQRVCEVGCGGGALTIALAGAVAPGGRAVGIDISAPLLELARSRASEAGTDNVDFVVADVQTDRLRQRPFDLAVSQLGVMFFDEPLVAFGAIRASLNAGGRLIFVCWQGVERNRWHVATALRPLIPPPAVPAPGKSPVGPFTLGDDEYVRDLLASAGFTRVESSPYELTVRAPASAVVDRSLLQFMGVAADRVEDGLALVERHLSQFAVGPDEFEYPLAFRVYEAANG